MTDTATTAWQLPPMVIPDGDERQMWSTDGVLTLSPVPAARLLPGRFATAGLVDSHIHVALGDDRQLGIVTPWVRWFELVDEQARWPRFGFDTYAEVALSRAGLRAFVDLDHLRGVMFADDPGAIYVRSDLRDHELVRVVAHETRHAYNAEQYVPKLPREQDEREAVKWAQNFCEYWYPSYHPDRREAERSADWQDGLAARRTMNDYEWEAWLAERALPERSSAAKRDVEHRAAPRTASLTDWYRSTPRGRLEALEAGGSALERRRREPLPPILAHTRPE